MEVPKDQIATLMEHGLYDSAETIGFFLVSSSTVGTETSPHLKAENLIILGDALFQQREYRRAIHTYKQALQHYTRIPKQSSSISRSSLSLSTRSSVNASGNSAINENEVRFKISSSHFALNETKAAIAEMESVKSRSLEMNILMAKLHRSSGYNRGAIAFYKECLRQCPYVLEAVIGLAELGVTAKDITSSFTQVNLSTRFLLPLSFIFHYFLQRVLPLYLSVELTTGEEIKGHGRPFRVDLKKRNTIWIGFI